jgi:outer membrane protein OmpA-like peptidoglycan-associated protein
MLIAYSPEPKSAPPADRDGDKIPDERDACPDVKGSADEDPQKHGCPRDRDGDAIPDEEDACPEVKGVASADPKQNGCPPDRDGDGILDAVDACPDVKGVASADPKRNGCPVVRLTEKEIVVLEQVQFESGRATILGESASLLDSVAALLHGHPEIARVEVQGHTDNRGLKEQNLTLSRARAEAVARALIERGVAPGRLLSRGFGSGRPVIANVTERGRQTNRRVQFVIIQRAPRGPAAKGR